MSPDGGPSSPTATPDHGAYAANHHHPAAGTGAAGAGGRPQAGAPSSSSSSAAAGGGGAGAARSSSLSSTLTFTRSASVLGYCLLPLVATSMVGVVLPMNGHVGIALT